MINTLLSARKLQLSTLFKNKRLNKDGRLIRLDSFFLIVTVLQSLLRRIIRTVFTRPAARD
jgi:hypothetical protein